jgi:hypothetical protein
MPAIFDHHIDDMLTAVMKALGKEDLKDEATGKAVREALESCWMDTGAITWTVNDIRGEYPSLTREQARDVLAEMTHGHDASIGICWDNIESYVYRAVPDYDPFGEDEYIASAVDAYAKRLTAAGDRVRFEQVFGRDIPAAAVVLLDADELRDIYRNWLLDEDGHE